MKSFYHQFLSPLVGGLLCLLTGCCSHCGRLSCDRCADILPGAIPQPTGAHVCAWQATQDALAERDDFVVYQYEWIDNTTELSPFGRRHVDGLVDRLETQPFSIVLEPAENAPLNAERRLALMARLASHGVPDADARVIMGYPTAEGLYGQEASQLSRGYLRGGTQGRGFGNGGGLGGSRGMGGTGFSGGGAY